ncbi:hypothetical protein [Tissierella sp.]|uniref:hypothetical protein n=1 Tax=Tissierella sp. TaxID=41274 RepID=UPI0030D8DA82
MKTVLRLFLERGISFGEPHIMGEKSHHRVSYAEKETLEENIILEMEEAEELESEEREVW